MTRVTPYSTLSSVCLLSTLLAAPLGADTVHLKNGRSFEDVVAEVHGSEVRIRLPHGELRLAATSVAHIEKSDTVLAGYLGRKAALGPTTPAAGWLELAQWARSQGHEPGVREAVLEAARLDPNLEGLAPFLRQLGFHSQDPDTGRWLTETEVMNRRGFVSDGGQWVTREVAEMRENARAQERQARRAEAAEANRRAAEARFERAVNALALREARAAATAAEEAERTRRQNAPLAVSYLSAGYWHFPVVFPPSVILPPPPTAPLPETVPGAQRHDAVQGNSFDYNALVGRQPGSILPMTVDPGRPR